METTKDFEELEEKQMPHIMQSMLGTPWITWPFTQNSNEALVLKDVQKELREHDGVVWRMILSLKEEDALNLGFTEKRKWEDLLRSTVPDAAKKWVLQKVI
ncbi:hypothetical protein LQK80_00735 [Bacillus thuringiensis]|nr:hypothetical protein [Bacillus thuringiensis]